MDLRAAASSSGVTRVEKPSYFINHSFHGIIGSRTSGLRNEERAGLNIINSNPKPSRRSRDNIDKCNHLRILNFID
jgi:hypothetical protein